MKSFLDLLPPVLLHHKDLDHADKNVEEVELQGDAFVDRVTAHHTSLGEAGVVENLLDIVQGETAEYGQTTVEPQVLGEGERAHSGDGDHERGKSRCGHDSSTSQEGTTNVQVLFLLSSGTDH